MDPLAYSTVLNDSITYPIILAPTINATLHSDLPYWAQFLASFAGLSGIIALFATAFAIWYNHLRGPIIKCSNIRYLLLNSSDLHRTGYSASIFPQLNFTNIGSRSGTIETLKLELVTEEGFVLEFVPYIDNMELRFLQEGHNLPPAFDSPLHSFTIAPGASMPKRILFVNTSGFNFIRSTYLLRVFYNTSGTDEFLLCSQRRIRLNQDIERTRWLVSFDPLGTAEFFEFPLQRVVIQLRIELNP